jgi:hypothetical protein
MSDRIRQLAEQYRVEVEKPAKDGPEISICFSCGGRFVKSDFGRFCSSNCREQYDAGLPSFERMQELQSYVRLTDGVMLSCLGCGKKFRSRGVRCCSRECEAKYVRECSKKNELTELRAETGVSGTSRKRPCGNPECSNTIPPWTATGRKTSTRFCSKKCERKARSAHRELNGENVPKGIAEVPAAQALAKSPRSTEDRRWRVIAGPPLSERDQALVTAGASSPTQSVETAATATVGWPVEIIGRGYRWPAAEATRAALPIAAIVAAEMDPTSRCENRHLPSPLSRVEVYQDAA